MKITKKDRKRLQPHLDKGVNHLTEMNLLGSFDIEDLRILLELEKEGRNRRELKRRLLGRIYKLERLANLEQDEYSSSLSDWPQ